ncbi:hypothetical protein G7Y89_g15182 [Cudoniella acicularis]|uniref:Uncharacterized protein n=1 Tax=Cudoniella acicularis TaxID=354080 RepID=A0A8H4QSM6_9HELO|nr:hypothetical protein G7Y89_g15182 [Cudoniella acicularis]
MTITVDDPLTLPPAPVNTEGTAEAEAVVLAEVVAATTPAFPLALTGTGLTSTFFTLTIRLGTPTPVPEGRGMISVVTEPILAGQFEVVDKTALEDETAPPCAEVDDGALVEPLCVEVGRTDEVAETLLEGICVEDGALLVVVVFENGGVSVGKLDEEALELDSASLILLDETTLAEVVAELEGLLDGVPLIETLLETLLDEITLLGGLEELEPDETLLDEITLLGELDGPTVLEELTALELTKHCWMK